MDISKILEMLGVDKLDESKKEEIQTKLQNIIEVKIDEKVKDKLTEEKENLVEEYAEKFETYKEDVISKFSNFLDSVLDEELSIPEKIVEYARKGELYEDLIEQFKVRLSIDEGLLDEEVKGLLREAKETIQSYEGEINELTNNNLQVTEDAKKLSAALYIRDKCDGLSESKKKRVMSLLEDITSKEKIDDKFDIIVETVNEEDDDKSEMSECVCPECGKTSSVKGACSTAKCPDCDVALTDAKKEKDEGKGLTDTGNKLDEDTDTDGSPFEASKNIWLKMLKESK